jgi:hypothetical protein
MPGVIHPKQVDPNLVDANIASAWTLPSTLYTDASVFAAEKEKICADDVERLIVARVLSC